MELRLVTVGVLQLDDQLACLLMMQRGKATLYCVELDAATSLFVSPLYEHSLVLYGSATQPGAEARQRMEQARCETLFRVLEWQAWQCLLEDNLSATMLPKRLCALLSRTLFIQSAYAQPVGATAALHQLYAPKARETAFCSSESLLGPYLQELWQQADKERPRRQTLAVAFWQLVEARDQALIQGAVNQLFAYEKKTSVYPTMREVTTLLQGWKLPCARYVSHKVDQMASIHQLYRATLCKGDSTAPLAQSMAFSLFNCSLLPPTITQDAGTLIAFLWSHLTDDEEQCVIEASLFVRYRRLIDCCLLEGGIGRLLDSLYHKQRSLAERSVVLRHRLLMRFLLPLLVTHLEQHVTRQSAQGRSTLECLTLRTIYLAYAALFRPGGNKAALADLAEQQFALGQEDDARPAVQHLFEFDLVDFNLALSTLHQCLQQDEPPPWRAQYKWRARPQWDTAELLPKTVLFYVETQPALLEMETKINTHYDRHLFETLLSVQLCESHEVLGPQAVALFSEHEEEQQYRMVLFDPLELRQNRDLEFMRELALADLYATALVRESSTNHFFRDRLARAFLGELEHDQWYRELYFETAQFRVVDRAAVQRTVIVADAHLLTSNDLLGLLRWLTFHRATIKRVVMVGSADLAPLSQNGQPFIDLLLRVDAPRVRRQAFADDRRDRLMAGLLGQWTLHRWPQEKDDRARIARRHDWSQTPALYVLQEDTMEELEDLFYLLQRYRRFTLHQLYKGDRPTQLVPRKKSLLRVVPLELDTLMQHHRVTPDEEAFVILWRDLLRLQRNALTLLLSTLERLIILGCPEQDPKQALQAHVARDKRPTLRYTQSSMK
jgi:hypothetical protein